MAEHLGSLASATTSLSNVLISCSRRRVVKIDSVTTGYETHNRRCNNLLQIERKLTLSGCKMETRSTAKRRRVRERETTIENTVSINHLPDDCLFHIFSFLGIEDRLSSTAVSKRWRNFKAAAWRDVKKLDIITLENSKTQHPRLLKLCGRLLTDLTISVSKDSNIIRVVTKNCPNLLKFKVQFEYEQGDKAEHCKDLTKLFVKNKVKLRSVVLDNMGVEFALHTDCLLNLPEKLVELQLWRSTAHLERDPRKRIASMIPLLSITPVIERLKNLEILVLNGLKIDEDEVEMIGNLRNLRYLEIYGSDKPMIFGIDSIANSRNLEYFSLRGLLSPCDSWVNELVQNNPGLKHLKLTRSYLSEEAHDKLVELSKLETLSLRYCLFDNNFHLSGFRNLKKFISTHFRDSEIILLMEAALGLEFVELDGCLNSPRVLRKAHEVTSLRTNNIPLHVVVPGNLIQQWRKPVRLSSLLRVESSEDYRARTENKYTGYDVELFY